MYDMHKLMTAYNEKMIQGINVVHNVVHSQLEPISSFLSKFLISAPRLHIVSRREKGVREPVLLVRTDHKACSRGEA